MTWTADRRPVLAGIDGSTSAARAARFAADEAARRGASLRLVHALLWPFDGSPLVGIGAIGPDEKEPQGDLRTNVEDRLRDLAASLADPLPPERIEWAVQQGDPVAVLRAASADAQLTVVGARGIGGVAGMLIGSTATGLASTAPCPVVVLPDDTAVSVSERRSVVVGVEGSEQDDEVLEFAFAAAARHTELIAVHAWQHSALDTAVRSAGPLVDWAAARSHEQRVLSETIAGWREKEPGVPVREVVIRDWTARALAAASLLAELLVVGRRHVGRLAGIGSATHGVLRRAGCPVAIVPTGQRADDEAEVPDQRARREESGVTSAPERTTAGLSGIVVGVDGSPSSEQALRWAVDQARRTGQTVHAVIAWEFPLAYGTSAIDPGVDWAEESRATLQATVDHVLGGAAAPRVEQHVRRGHPAGVLLDAAAAADLLVVGSRGHGGFTGMLLGSVSQHLAVRAPCPVLIMHGAEPE